MTEQIAGTDYYASRQLALTLDDGDHGVGDLLLSLHDPAGRRGADEIRLTLHAVTRLTEHLADWTRRRQPDDSGTTTLGTIAFNGRGEICFFPTARADGTPIPDRHTGPSAQEMTGFLKALKALYAAIETAPRRRIPHTTLHLLDPPDEP